MKRFLIPAFALLVLALAVAFLGLGLTGSAQAAPRDEGAAEAVAIRARDTLVQFGDPVHVAADERVGSVVAFGGPVTVEGTVTRNIIAFGGDVRLLPSAVVGGGMSEEDVSILAMGGRIEVEEGAEVTGQMRRGDSWSDFWSVNAPGVDPLGWSGFSFFGWLIQTAVFLVLGLVAAALLPRQMTAIGRVLANRPGPSLGWGALTFFIIVPVAAVVLLISIIGILLLIPAIVVVPLFYFFVTLSVAVFIVQRILSGNERVQGLMLATTIAVIATTIVSRIPVGGGLAMLAMTLFGTGAAVLAVLDWRRARRTVPAYPGGTPAPTQPSDAAAAAYRPAPPAAYPSVPPAPPMEVRPDDSPTAVTEDMTSREDVTLVVPLEASEGTDETHVTKAAERDEAAAAPPAGEPPAEAPAAEPPAVVEPPTNDMPDDDEARPRGV
jgi:hypothetical protein